MGLVVVIRDFPTKSTDRYPKQYYENIKWMLHALLMTVYIGSGNGLVPSSHTQLHATMLTQIFVTKWGDQAIIW